MEADGIITRTIYPEVLPRVEYSLSEFGKSMRTVINAMAEWGTQYKKSLEEEQPAPEKCLPSAQSGLQRPVKILPNLSVVLLWIALVQLLIPEKQARNAIIIILVRQLRLLVFVDPVDWNFLIFRMLFTELLVCL